MSDITVDGSLVFRFSKPWRALDWEKSKERLTANSRKTVDIAATGPKALLVEVKDDRLKSAKDADKRAQDLKSGKFLADMAAKFRHSLTDILDVAARPGADTFYTSLVARWNEEKRLLLLWWELPTKPPLGVGTRDARWKAHLSPLRNTLRQHLYDLTPRVRIANQRFDKDVVQGMTVENVAPGIAKRREAAQSIVTVKKAKKPRTHKT